MRFTFFNPFKFIKFIYYTYLAGLVFLTIYAIVFPIILFTPLTYLWWLQFFLPFAGFLGTIPFSVVIFIILNTTEYAFFIGYAILIPTIVVQYKVVIKLKEVLKGNRPSSGFLNGIALHHMAVAFVLVFDIIYLYYYNVIWYPRYYQTVIYPNFRALLSDAWLKIVLDIYGSALNISLAIVIWRWIKSG